MYVCKEMVILIPPPIQQNNKQKVHTTHVNKTNKLFKYNTYKYVVCYYLTIVGI